ncbi:unnamed protein product [Mytilus coruscus]|uniref:SGNH domain-containing protein n=1 Tax=Mytilus coruscus TaxID=42192 RepID=A0A6J8C1U8_MYTCO|nr:unnamed protein product [Mytilus coruscus]
MDSITEESARLFSDSLAGNTWKSYSRARSVLASFQLLYTLSAMLRKSVNFSNIPNPSRLKSHSFRIGAATEAGNRGIYDEPIKKWERRSSGAFERYIRIPWCKLFSAYEVKRINREHQMLIFKNNSFAPDIKIIWSDILPRPYWHGTLRPKLVEIAGKRVKCAVKSFKKKEGQYILRYPAIKASESNLFRHDGTHLSQVGIGIFLNNIQAAIETFVLDVAKVFPPNK